MNSYTRLHHIIWAIDSIHEFGDLDLDDKKTFAAVVYFLQIIGEASKKVDTEVKKLAPDIPWKNIAAFRNYAVHEYHGLDIKAIQKALVMLPDIESRIHYLIRVTTHAKP